MYARRLLALLALLVVPPTLAGCGADDLSTASIAEAADATVAERGMRIAIEQTLTIPNAGPVSTRGTGVMDAAGQASHLKMTVTSVPDVVRGAFDETDLSTEVITDHTVVYTRSPQLSQLLGSGDKWLKLDAAEVGRAAGVDVSAFTQSGHDPTLAMRQLKAVSGKVETVGRDDVRGVATTHYRATVDLRRYPALVAGADRAAARASIDRLIEETGVSRVPVDVWIGDDDRVRRLTQKLPLEGRGGSGAIDQRFEFYDFGVDVDIEIPAPGEVHDVSDLAASGAATIGP